MVLHILLVTIMLNLLFQLGLIFLLLAKLEDFELHTVLSKILGYDQYETGDMVLQESY